MQDRSAILSKKHLRIVELITQFERRYSGGVPPRFTSK